MTTLPTGAGFQEQITNTPFRHWPMHDPKLAVVSLAQVLASAHATYI